ncbi:MAG: hypothetical protein KGN77_09070 [Xanthomonadaceae bacterium]|nr:hypothetical protein [Xanthomonadaceae bacterium]MDE1963691.1 hypothetical protein [Xanthomonadaceae bacterium]
MFEVPIPLEITLKHGEGSILGIAEDVPDLTQLNCDACQFGKCRQITIKDSGRVGEILLANRVVSSDNWKPNFNYYS